MKRISLIFLILAVSVVSLNAQSKNKKFDVQSIKSDTTYYWGESAVFDEEADAMEASMNNLFVNIANNYKASAIYLSDEDQKTQLKKIIATFSFRIEEKITQHPVVYDFENEEYSYLVYIKRSDFREICNARKKYIERLAMRGYESEEDENLKLEDALKSYYWGMMLCVAHPYGNSLKININGENVDAYLWFRDRIDDVLSSFNFNIARENAIVKDDKGLTVGLNVTSSKGMDVSNLQFDYYNGQKYITTKVNDGKSFIFLNNYDKTGLDKIKIKIDYEFKSSAQIDQDINKILNEIEHKIKFNNIRVIEIEPHLKKTVEEEDVPLGKFAEMEAASIENSDFNSIDKAFNVENTDYLSIIQEVEKAFRTKNYESVRRYFTEEGFGMIDTLTKYGNMTVVGQQEYVFLKFGKKVLCRDINMQFEFRNHASFNRNVVFRFDDTSKKIESIAFRLSAITENDIVKKTKWPQESRLHLINFLEDYQTAYALKRLDYLESIYSDDALIIVGHVVKKYNIPDRIGFNLPEDEIILKQHDKNTYFKNLARTFKAQEYIELHFADTDFMRAPVPTREIYGVRLLQEYHSSTYGDVGYLFLLVDLTERNKPLIHVRAWQPDEVDLEKLMGMKDLRF